MLCLCSRPLIRLDAHLLPSYLKFRLPLYQLVSVALAKTVTGYTLGGKDCRVIYITAVFFFFSRHLLLGFYSSDRAMKTVSTKTKVQIPSFEKFLWQVFSEAAVFPWPQFAVSHICGAPSPDSNETTHARWNPTVIYSLRLRQEHIFMSGERLPLAVANKGLWSGNWFVCVLVPDRSLCLGSRLRLQNAVNLAVIKCYYPKLLFRSHKRLYDTEGLKWASRLSYILRSRSLPINLSELNWFTRTPVCMNMTEDKNILSALSHRHQVDTGEGAQTPCRVSKCHPNVKSHHAAAQVSCWQWRFHSFVLPLLNTLC